MIGEGNPASHNSTIRSKAICVVLALTLSLIASGPSDAQDSSRVVVGFRGGGSAINSDEKLVQCEVFAIYELPWSQRWSSGWVLGPWLNLTAGALRGGGKTGLIGSAGPCMALSKAGSPISLDAGTSVALLSEDQFGHLDVGGRFHFVTHGSISSQLGRNLQAGYRFQHMSNAGIEEQNPGLDLHMLELSYRL